MCAFLLRNILVVLKYVESGGGRFGEIGLEGKLCVGFGNSVVLVRSIYRGTIIYGINEFKSIFDRSFVALLIRSISVFSYKQYNISFNITSNFFL